MKKILLVFGTLGMFAMFSSKPVIVKAETVEEAEQETVIDEETQKQTIREVLGEYMDASLVAKIITWAIDAGVLTSLFCVCVKYKKYKNTTTGDLIKMFKDEVGEYLKKNFDELSAEKLKAVVDKVDDLEKSLETMMKVLVLAQDTTSSGKIALIDYLGSKTNSEEVKESANEVKEQIAQEQAKEAELKEKVSGEYENLF